MKRTKVSVRQEPRFMPCCHVLASAAFIAFFGVSAIMPGAARQKPPQVPSEVRAACDNAYAVAAATPGVSVKRRIGTFTDEMLREPVFGCGLAISGSFARAKTTGDATERLREDFSSRGWGEMPAYGADGMDGTSFAYRKAGVTCLVRGTWNGGAAGEPEIPAEDWYRVAVICTSRAIPDKR